MEQSAADTLVTAAISAGAALLGALIGSVSSYFVARQQIRASVISGNRQAWINNLRDSLSQYQATIAMLGMHYRRHVAGVEEHVLLERLGQLRSQVHLLVNPNEADHQELLSAINGAANEIFKMNVADTAKIRDFQAQLTSIGQRVLKREWERVKKGA